MIAEAPINFKDSQGAWQPIDDHLVAADAAGFAYKNTLDSYQVEFPADMASGPIRLSTGGKWLAFSLRGASPSSGVVSGNGITYSNVLPGVTVTYYAQPDGLKESLTLANATAASSFIFDATASAGLAGKAQGGGFHFSDSAGKLAMLLSAPWVGDASSDLSGFAGAVSFTGTPTADGLTLTLSVARSWLTASSRQFPVVIDPNISPTGTAVTDCHLVQAFPTTTYCGSTAREVGLGASPNTAQLRRTVMKFDTSALPTDAQVLGADLGVYVTNMFNTTAALPVQLHSAGTSWSTAATWNTTNGSTAWPNGAGNPSAAISFTGSAGPTVNTWSYLSFIPLVQGWVNGSTTNNGVVLTSGNETSPGIARFNSSRAASNTPTVTVFWEPISGQQPSTTYLNTPISGHSTLGVNPATGNMLLSTKALAVKGTNLDFDVSRFYNSRIAADGAGDNGIYPWTSSIGHEDSLLIRNVNNGVTNSVSVGLPGGGYVPFERRSLTGAFVSPPGIDATLQLSSTPGSGSDTLLFHSSGLKYTYTETPVGQSDLISITSKTGNKITMTRIGAAPTSATDTQGRTFNFHGVSSPEYVNDVNGGRTATYATPSGGAGFTDANGGVYTYGFDAAGVLLTSVTDPRGTVTTIAYDSSSRVSKVSRTTTDCTNASVPVTTSYSYGAQDGAGPAGTNGMTTVTDPTGHTTRYYYDAARRVIQVTDNLNRKRQTSYDPTTGNVASLTDNLGMATTATYYAGQSNLQTVTGPTETDGTKLQRSYGTYTGTNQPAPSSVTDTRNNKTTFGFTTDSNNVNQSTSPSGRVNKLSYNTNGTVATQTNGLGGITTFGYDAVGNLTKVTPPGTTLGATIIGVDADSRRVSVTDGKGQLTRTTYDKLDRTTSVTYADGTYVNYTYDADDNLQSRTDRNGAVSNISYDSLNRPRTQSDPGSGETATICYSPGSDVTSVQQQKGSADLGTTTYGYDTVGSVTSVQEPGGNCGNQPNGYPSVNSGCVTFTYDGANRRATQTYPGGIKTTNTYSNSGLVTNITTRKLDNTIVKSRADTYEEPIAGGGMRMTSSVASVTDELGHVTNYNYNTDNELSTASSVPNATGTTSYGYTYDADGNRLTSSLNGTNNFNATYTTADLLTSHTFSGNMPVQSTYDPNGNLTSTTAGFRANYDTANLTTSITNSTGSQTLTMGYEATGQALRTQAGTAQFTNSVLGLIADSGNAARYTRLPGGALISQQLTGGPSASRYYLTDRQNSIIALLDSTGSGTTVANYYYSPYGETTATGASSNNPFRYISGYQDTATGLYKLGIRYYDPALGRFTQQDPTGKEANAYLYAGSDPINNTDPNGADDVTTSLPELNGCVTADGNPVANCVPASGAYTQATCGADVLFFSLPFLQFKFYASAFVLFTGYSYAVNVCSSLPVS